MVWHSRADEESSPIIINRPTIAQGFRKKCIHQCRTADFSVLCVPSATVVVSCCSGFSLFGGLL